MAGAAQKGVSAVVIAFGAAAFGACAYGAYLALFPSAGSTQMIAADAMDAVSMDPSVADALGTPLRSYGIDHGTSRGRRNAMERWDREEIGADGDPAEYTTIRFHVAGPLGAAYVHAQVPAKRRRGELRYVIVEDIRTRRLTYVVDNRMQEMEEANAKAAAAAAAAEAAAAKEPALDARGGVAARRSQTMYARAASKSAEASSQQRVAARYSHARGRERPAGRSLLSAHTSRRRALCAQKYSATAPEDVAQQGAHRSGASIPRRRAPSRTAQRGNVDRRRRTASSVGPRRRRAPSKSLPCDPSARIGRGKILEIGARARRVVGHRHALLRAPRGTERCRGQATARRATEFPAAASSTYFERDVRAVRQGANVTFVRPGGRPPAQFLKVERFLDAKRQLHPACRSKKSESRGRRRRRRARISSGFALQLVIPEPAGAHGQTRPLATSRGGGRPSRPTRRANAVRVARRRAAAIAVRALCATPA